MTPYRRHGVAFRCVLKKQLVTYHLNQRLPIPSSMWRLQTIPLMSYIANTDQGRLNLLG